MGRLMESIDLPRSEGVRYRDGILWGVLIYPVAHRTTVEQACHALEGTPHPATVRGVVRKLSLARLEGFEPPA